MDESNNLSMEIINFEKEFDLIDNQVAFGSQLSVERVHDIKSQA
ncbi:LBP_cg2779 family protein, partial [Klebsiella michiganensis]